MSMQHVFQPPDHWYVQLQNERMDEKHFKAWLQEILKSYTTIQEQIQLLLYMGDMNTSVWSTREMSVLMSEK